MDETRVLRMDLREMHWLIIYLAYRVVNLIFLKVRRKQEGGGKEGKETIGNREKRIVGINGGMHATSLNWLKSDCAPGTIQKNCKLLTKLNFLPFTF